jgi:integrase
MPSVWIRTRLTPKGKRRFRVEYRLGGRGSKIRYGGSFPTMRLATMRKNMILGDLARLRVPDLTLAVPEEAPRQPTLNEAAKRWLASRIDASTATMTRYRVELRRIERLPEVEPIGGRRVDQIDPAIVAEFVQAMAEEGLKAGTIRKQLQTAAMVFDHSGVSPNPARDKQVRLPRGEEEELNPPSAEHVEAVFRLLPTRHRLPLLWLDWSGARVASVDLTRVGDYDEPRRRVRLRATTTKTRRALWVDLPEVLADAVEASLGPREDRDPDARLFAGSGADQLRTAIAKACKAAAIPLFSPHDLRHRRISLLHLRGVPWARIGEFVGQKSLKVTADTYTHVLVDEAEVDYAVLLDGRGV